MFELLFLVGLLETTSAVDQITGTICITCDGEFRLFYLILYEIDFIDDDQLAIQDPNPQPTYVDGAKRCYTLTGTDDGDGNSEYEIGMQVDGKCKGVRFNSVVELGNCPVGTGSCTTHKDITLPIVIP